MTPPLCFNPNHPTSALVNEHWHKIAALLVTKFGGPDATVVITSEDIAAIGERRNIAVLDDASGLTLRMVDDKTGMELARKEGGLPT